MKEYLIRCVYEIRKIILNLIIKRLQQAKSRTIEGNLQLNLRTTMQEENEDILEQITTADYKYGFVTDIEADAAPKGLSEDIVRFISAKKNEPEWLLSWRLKAYRHWLTLKEPTWPNVHYPTINYQDIIYYSAPKQKIAPNSLDEIDPELRDTFEKLGISLNEQKRLSGIAVDAVMDSVSVATTFKGELSKKCS